MNDGAIFFFVVLTPLLQFLNNKIFSRVLCNSRLDRLLKLVQIIFALAHNEIQPKPMVRFQTIIIINEYITYKKRSGCKKNMRPHERTIMMMEKRRIRQKSCRRKREVQIQNFKRFSELRVVTLANIIGAQYTPEKNRSKSLKYTP